MEDDFTNLLKSELDILGFYDVPTICSKYKYKACKPVEYILETVKSKGYDISRTQFALQGIKTDMPYEEFIEILK